MAVGEESRYNFTVRMRQVDVSGQLVEPERLDIPYPRTPVIQRSRPDLHEYKVREGDTWSNIASRFLRGRSDLWWVIAEFTGVVDAFEELTVGSILRIPSFDMVMFDVLNFDIEQPRRDSAFTDEGT